MRAIAMGHWLGLSVLVLSLISNYGVSMQIVKTLPGYNGTLPFKLETGYITVGEMDDLEIFYYFIESGKNPARDPLLLWLTGGPGCSGFSGLVYEIGPLIFDYASFNGSLPQLNDNPHSWTRAASIIFIDAPVGTGFSYSTTQEGYDSSDTKSAYDNYQFLRKWMVKHPQFSKVPLYISGDSYSGMIVPQVAWLVHEGNKAGKKPTLNLQGHILGNPVTDLIDDQNSRVEFSHKRALISDELYESAVHNCQGNYIDPDVNNTACVDDVAHIAQCTLKICDAAILEPKCSFAKPKPKPKSLNWGRKFFDEDMPDELLQMPSENKENWCRNSNYVLSYMWANDGSVQQAVGVRNGTVPDWKRCNKSLAYTSNLNSSVTYNYKLLYAGYRALVYSGDHDLLIPYVGTETWIEKLNMTNVDFYRPWFVDGQVAGYTVKYATLLGDGLTYCTVKGAGHTAPEYKPLECYNMIDRWLSYYLL